MRVVFGLVVILGMAVIGFFVWKARRAKGSTPALDAVVTWMDAGATRGDVDVRGAIKGRAVAYENKQYRSAMWTEVDVKATGPLAFTYKAAAIGDPLEFSGDPGPDARRVIAELDAAIKRAHPRSIVVGDGAVHLIADRTIETGDDARAFIQLALDLAAKVDGGSTAQLPPPPPETNRPGNTGEAEKNMALRVAVFVPVMLLFVGGVFWFIRRAAERRRAST